MAKRFSSDKILHHGKAHSSGHGKNKSKQGYWVWGKHAVEAVLKEGKREILNFLITSKASQFLTIRKGLSYKIVDLKELENILGKEAVHQGMAIQVKPYNDARWEDFIDREGPQCWVALDQVTDPHNVGAILRSAAVFGISGIILPKNNAPQESGIMAKAASGAIDLIPRCYITNLKTTIEDFKKQGFWIVGMAEKSTVSLSNFDWPEKTLLVMGSEGSGIRPLVRESCDYIARIPDAGSALTTLNVSNAASISFYSWFLSQR